MTDKSNTTTWSPEWAVAPGEVLQEALDDREMTQSELARRLGRPIKTINEIIKGKTAITPETAIQLERALGVKARFWTNLELNYRSALARTAERRNLEAHTSWLDDFPLADLAQRGLIKRGDSKVDTLESLLNFLGVGAPSAFDEVALGAAYRASPSFQASSKAVAAWLRWGEIQATALERPVAFDARLFESQLEQIRRLTREEPFDDVFQEVTSLCAAAGVVVLVVPEFSGTRLSGAAWWLGSTAVIQLSVRHKTNDQFWFTFFHEAGHLLAAGKRKSHVDEEADLDDNVTDPDEEEANLYARNRLLPPDAYQQFVLQGDFTKQAIRNFARAQQIAPGIVVGRLQRDDHVGHNQLRDLKRPVTLAGG